MDNGNVSSLLRSTFFTADLEEELFDWLISNPDEVAISSYASSLPAELRSTVLEQVSQLLYASWRSFAKRNQEILQRFDVPSLSFITALTCTDEEASSLLRDNTNLLAVIRPLIGSEKKFISVYTSGLSLMTHLRYIEYIPVVSTLCVMSEEIFNRVQGELIDACLGQNQNEEVVGAFLKHLYEMQIVPDTFISNSPLRNKQVLDFVEDIESVYDIVAEMRKGNPEVSTTEVLDAVFAKFNSEICLELGDRFDVILGKVKTDPSITRLHQWLSAQLSEIVIDPEKVQASVVTYAKSLTQDQRLQFGEVFFEVLEGNTNIHYLAQGIPIGRLATAVVSRGLSDAKWGQLLENLLQTVIESERGFARKYCTHILQLTQSLTALDV